MAFVASPRYKLNQEDMLKVGKGLMIALAGAGLTYLTNAIPNIDFGLSTPILVAVYSVLVNMLRKWMAS